MMTCIVTNLRFPSWRLVNPDFFTHGGFRISPKTQLPHVNFHVWRGINVTVTAFSYNDNDTIDATALLTTTLGVLGTHAIQCGELDGETLSQPINVSSLVNIAGTYIIAYINCHML